jgi:SAM-dependent methyltransferase
MTSPADGQYRFYGELARWWPLISPVDEYAEEAAFAVKLLRSASRPVREVLELGSGGGHNAAFLREHFDLTLADLSPEMVAMSRELNPDCAHHVGDMRTLRLGRDFDAVFVHDAVDYMTTADDLRQATATAYTHCRPGGVAVFVPDDLAETYQPGSDLGGTDGPDGRGVRFLEWSWDPDPADTWTVTQFAFLLREADGAVRTVHETHRTGLFARQVWLDLLREAGFHPEIVLEETTEDRHPREFLVAHRP